MTYIVGTRKSRLALAQTDWVISRLKEKNPSATFETKTITTKGDTDSRPLFAIDQKGIFEKEIDRQVSEGVVDFAVHSIKDVPTEIGQGLEIACVPVRKAADDVLVSASGASIESLPDGAKVGTSSLRRAVELMQIRKDLDIVPIRGNIETRIAKAESGQLDAIVLARAGIERLGVAAKFSALDSSKFVPSPGQGALGLVARTRDTDTVQMLQKIEDADSRAEVDAERAFSSVLDSGCRFPVGALASCKGGELSIHAVAFSADGAEILEVNECGSASEAATVGRKAGSIMIERGVGQLALNWRAKVSEWNNQ